MACAPISLPSSSATQERALGKRSGVLDFDRAGRRRAWSPGRGRRPRRGTSSAVSPNAKYAMSVIAPTGSSTQCTCTLAPVLIASDEPGVDRVQQRGVGAVQFDQRPRERTVQRLALQRLGLPCPRHDGSDAGHRYDLRQRFVGDGVELGGRNVHPAVRPADADDVSSAQFGEEPAEDRIRLNGCSRRTVSAERKGAARGHRSGPGCFGWHSRHRVEQVLTIVARTGRKAARMKLGLQLGYWGAQPPTDHAELVAAAEEAGFDTVFTAEAWGSDAYTPLAWWGRETTRMRLGTSVIQLSARTPTALRDGRADARSPLRRTPHPRPRRLRSAGRRGLVRRRSSPSRWPAPASTSTSCARSGPARRRCTATARTTRCR